MELSCRIGMSLSKSQTTIGAVAAIFIIAAILGAAGCGCSSERAAPELQGVVLVSIDTLRADRLPIYGYDRAVAPFLTQLGEQGVVFEQALAQSPWTGPSHGSLLTSRHPSALQLGDWRKPRPLPTGAVTLAEVLRDAGFRTHAVVGGGYLSARTGFDQGFERFEEEASFASSPSVDRALTWLEELPRDERFFLFLHTYQVHHYAPSPEASRRWVRSYDGPLLRVRSLPTLLEFPELWRRSLSGLQEADLRYVTDLYDAALYSVDGELARLHRLLASKGFERRTLFVVTSDHGEEFLDHGGTGHGWNLYQENLRVPLIVWHSSLPPRRIAQPVRLLDVSPTIVGLAGLDASPDWRGRSLEPLLRGEEADIPPAYAEHAHVPLRALRSGAFKYIEDLDGSAPQLFDLERDPTETNNLAGSDHEAEERLREALRAQAAAIAEAAFPARGSALDATLLQRLKELGYVEPPSSQ